jgi:hypothetical protein
MRTAATKSNMACVRFYDHGAAGIRMTAPLTVSATLWRRVAERYEWVFTFTGDADIFVVDAILEHVNQLIGCAPGEWGFEFVAAGPRPDVLRQIEHRFDELVRIGVRQYVAVAPFAFADANLAMATAGVGGLADGGGVLH